MHRTRVVGIEEYHLICRCKIFILLSCLRTRLVGPRTENCDKCTISWTLLLLLLEALCSQLPPPHLD